MSATADERPGDEPVAQVLRRLFLTGARHGPLPGLLLLLAVVSGLVDAVSILRMGHVFVANMTGNVVFVGIGLVGARGISLAAALTALAGFVVGASATSWLHPSWRADRARLLRTAAAAKLGLALPVVGLAAWAGFDPGRPATYVATGLLAASMGVQNATVRHLAVPDLATTVLTSTMTGLFSDLRQHGWRRPAATYRMASVLGIFAGAAVGAALVVGFGAVAALAVGAALLVWVGVVAHRATTGPQSWAAFPTG